MNNQDAKNILQPSRDLANARVRDLQSNPQSLFQRLSLDLTTAKTEANALKIGFGFKCIYVELATDTSTLVSFKPSVRSQNVSYLQLGRKDVIDFDHRIDGGFLFWSAQAAKTMTLVFILEASFKSGSQISQNSGGVSINEGSAVGAPTAVTLAAATAAAILPSDLDRKVSTLQNNTGADLWVGSATVTNAGATMGIKIASGQTLVWKNTAALYGYSVAGGTVNYMTES